MKLKYIFLFMAISAISCNAEPSKNTTAQNDNLSCVASTHTNKNNPAKGSHSFINIKNKNRTILKKEIPLPDNDFFQNRSYHCIPSRGFFYVLDQVDTHSQQNTNQTLLYIVKLSKNGNVLLRKYVSPPDSDNKIISSWVDKNTEAFNLINNEFVIKGKWIDKNNPDSNTQEFSTSMHRF